MFKDITIGQYIAGKSVIHRMDARLKLILTLLYIIFLFLISKPVSYLVVTALTVFIILLSRISVKYFLKGLRPMLVIIIFTVIINLFFTAGTPIWQADIFGLGIRITKEGVKLGVTILVRLTLLVCGTSLLTLTTSPIMLTDAIESVLTPLKIFKVPSHEIAMMMSIAIRFIPTIAEEADKIIKAQKARGADFESGNIIMRAKAMIPLLVPLFVSAFRRADELATAMECRCYHGGNGRTRMKILKMKFRDYFMIFISIAMMAGVILINLYAGGYTL